MQGQHQHAQHVEKTAMPSQHKRTEHVSMMPITTIYL
jgi:hypothetical protein